MGLGEGGGRRGADVVGADQVEPAADEGGGVFGGGSGLDPFFEDGPGGAAVEALVAPFQLGVG